MAFPQFPSAAVLEGAALDATAMLSRDHEQIRRLLDELAEAAGAGAYARKKEIFRALKAALHLHALLEEEVFYPAVMKLRSSWAKEAVREALAAH